jgi:hypothetical protein
MTVAPTGQADPSSPELTAHREQVLGDDHVRPQLVDERRVDRVQRPPVRDRRPHLPVDLDALPVDLSAELHIAGPDRASIAYRRRLAELAAAVDQQRDGSTKRTSHV